MKQFFLLSLLCLSSTLMFSWHIIGTDITYEHISNNTYEVKVTVYRDCNQTNGAPFDSPLILDIWKNSTQIGQQAFILNTLTPVLPDSLIGSCNISNTGICVQYATYKKTINMPTGSGTYILAYQRCCRSQNISNLAQPQTQGSTWYADLHHQGGAFTNSSPQFKKHMPVGFCINDTFNYDQSVTELDGDSLVYRLSNPTLGGSSADPYPSGPSGFGASAPPYYTVNWTPGYNHQNQLGTSAYFSIDQNGIISGYTTQQGRYTLAYAVDEYRAGVLVGTIRRDFAVYIVDSMPSFPTSAPDITIPVVPDLTKQMIYPNPCNGEFGFLNSGKRTIVASVYDIKGNKVSFAEIGSNQYAINQEQSKTGMYFVKYFEDGQLKTLKLYLVK